MKEELEVLEKELKGLYTKKREIASRLKESEKSASSVKCQSETCYGAASLGDEVVVSRVNRNVLKKALHSINRRISKRTSLLKKLDPKYKEKKPLQDRIMAAAKPSSRKKSKKDIKKITKKVAANNLSWVVSDILEY